MKIKINGEWSQSEGELTVARLLQQRNLEPRRVAVELNRRLLPRAKYDTTTLADSDELEIVTLVGGG